MIRVAPDGTVGWNRREKYENRNNTTDVYEVKTVACKQTSKARSLAGGREGKPSFPLASENATEAILQDSEMQNLTKHGCLFPCWNLSILRVFWLRIKI